MYERPFFIEFLEDVLTIAGAISLPYTVVKGISGLVKKQTLRVHFVSVKTRLSQFAALHRTTLDAVGPVIFLGLLTLLLISFGGVIYLDYFVTLNSYKTVLLVLLSLGLTLSFSPFVKTVKAH
jgi:hypothetical protein